MTFLVVGLLHHPLSKHGEANLEEVEFAGDVTRINQL